MEQIATAQPWQIAFFIVGCLIVAVVLCVWLATGTRHDSEPVTLDPIILAGELWEGLLHWRPVNMSSAEEGEPVRAGFRTGSWGRSPGSEEPVRSHQNQAEPLFETVHEPAHELPTLRKLTRTEEIALLAVQRNDDGSYRHSANKICELMGGTAADVKAQVAALRGTNKKEPPAPGAPLKRPVNGWN